MEEVEVDVDLDIKWIEEFESLDENYKNFYSEDITCITFNNVYVNKDNEIEKIKKDKLLLAEPNYISREEILGILKRNCKSSDNKRYTVLSILKYNINIDPSDVQSFLRTPGDLDSNEYLKSLTNIDAVSLDPSISMFQDLNEIIIIYYEKTSDDKNTAFARASSQTKRIYLKSLKTNKKRTYRKTT
jgi:hypothetical protein